MAEVQSVVEAARCSLEGAAAAIVVGHVARQFAGKRYSRNPILQRRIDYDRRGAAFSTEAIVDKEIVQRELAVVLPSVVEVICRLEARQRITGVERAVGK